jgi:cytoskeleton protein RodZ
MGPWRAIARCRGDATLGQFRNRVVPSGPPAVLIFRLKRLPRRPIRVARERSAGQVTSSSGVYGRVRKQRAGRIPGAVPVPPRRRTARRARDARQVAARRPARPAHQGGLSSTRSRIATCRCFRIRASSPGYVRSYARYLHLDPDEVYRRFCQESGFGGVHRYARPERCRSRRRRACGRRAVPPGCRRAGRVRLPARRAAAPRPAGDPVRALGSLLVLAALIGGLGYGGWTVLQNIQRVQFAPVEEVPVALAEVAPLEAPETAQGPVLPGFRGAGRGDGARRSLPPAGARGADPRAARRADRRDRSRPDRAARAAARGPRRPSEASLGDAARAPATSGARTSILSLSRPRRGGPPSRRSLPRDGRGSSSSPSGRPGSGSITRTASVIFERILESGEVYACPRPTSEADDLGGQFRLGLSRIGETLHGPIGSGTRDVPRPGRPARPRLLTIGSSASSRRGRRAEREALPSRWIGRNLAPPPGRDRGRSGGLAPSLAASEPSR